VAGRAAPVCPYLRIDPLKVEVGRIGDVMNAAYAEKHRCLPVVVGATEITVATCEALRHGLDGTDRRASAQAHQARRQQPARRGALHHRVLHAGQERARGDQVRREHPGRQLRATGGAGPQQQAARRQRPGRGAGGGLAVAVRLRPARQRHPPGAAPRDGRDPLPHRRRAAHRLPAAGVGDERHGVAHQAARSHGCGGAAAPARRPHQDAQPGRRRGGDAPLHTAHRLRREDGDAHLRPPTTR
jgi:hypothetical protein